MYTDDGIDRGDVKVFESEEVNVTVGLKDGKVFAIGYDFAFGVAITRKQAMEILSKNSPTKRIDDCYEDGQSMFHTQTATNKHRRHKQL
jgi:hypothetical protein